MPNWNSCTMPVTMPIAKLMRKIFPKNRVRWSHFTSAVRNHMVWKIATNSDMPSVRGTKMKWYSVVSPNCHRASSSGSRKSMRVPSRAWVFLLTEGTDGAREPIARAP